MVEISEAIVRKIIFHKIGYDKAEPSLDNKLFEYENEVEEEIIRKIFLKPFSSNTTTYEFSHEINLDLNVLFSLSKNIFEGNDFIENSLKIYKYLKSVSKHPNIKEGDFFLIKYDDVRFNNKYYEALGIYKVENKESFLEINDDCTDISFKKGIGTRKLDKACLILFTEVRCTIFIIDNISAEADYWKNDFINVKLKDDFVNHTSGFLNLAKSYVTNQLSKEFEVSKADKIDLLNKSIDFFKQNENFDINSFSNEVIKDPAGIESFKKYKKTYENENEKIFADTFEISDAAVKKQVKVFKGVIKLDKNFHIYIHGSNELIERGFDKEKSMSYYKVYFKEEV